MAEPKEHITNDQIEKLFKLADEVVRAPSRFTKDFVVENLALGVADLCGVIDRLRAQLAEIGDEWSYETRNSWSGWRRCATPMTEEYARKRAASSDRNRLVHRKASEWREVEQESDRG